MKKILLLFFLVQISLNASAQQLPRKSFIHVTEKTIPAVVFIATEINSFEQSWGSNPSFFAEYLRPFYEWWWPSQFFHGSGFIMNPEGYIITNRHVIEDKTSVFVAMRSPTWRLCKATLVGNDTRSDVAVLKIDNPNQEKFPYLKFGNSDQIKIGQQVFFIGNPLCPQLEATVTMGIISAKERNNFYLDAIEGYIQTDATLNGGNSGGPLINLKGEVIGIAEWVCPHFWGIEGLGFAIPSKTVESIASQIIKNGKTSHGFLGVVVDHTEESAFDVYYFDRHEGAYIQEIVSDSPAEKSGLQVGDCIVKIDDFPLQSSLSLRNRICILEPNTLIRLTLERNGEKIELSAQLGSEELTEKHAQIYSDDQLVL